MFNDLLKRLQQLVGENSTAILTGVGVAGTVTTAVLSGRASYNAARFITQEQYSRTSEPGGAELTTKEKIHLVWPSYIPTVGVGTLTITSIILSNRMSSKQVAAMAAAYGISEKAFQEYKDKVVEKLGQNKATGIRDEIAQDRVNANPANTREVIITGSGDVLCFDMFTGRYFESSVETIKKAENTINYEIVNHMYASLSQFYDEVGLLPTTYSDAVGWNIENRCEVQFSTVMSIDDRPCVAIDFATMPRDGYSKLWG